MIFCYFLDATGFTDIAANENIESELRRFARNAGALGKLDFVKRDLTKQGNLILFSYNRF